MRLTLSLRGDWGSTGTCGRVERDGTPIVEIPATTPDPRRVKGKEWKHALLRCLAPLSFHLLACFLANIIIVPRGIVN